jgi:hypothetical protein
LGTAVKQWKKRAERISTRLISIEQSTGCSGNGLAITNLRNFINLRNIHSLDVVSSH